MRPAFHKSAQQITVKKSTILHPQFGLLSLYTTRIIDKEEAVGYYCGSLVYVDLRKERYRTKSYGDSVMQVTVEASRM